MLNGAVKRTVELERILNLPRRTAKDYPKNLAQKLTELLKTENGTQSLREIQAQALYDMGAYGGMFGPIAVGNGKSLISLLAPYVLEAERPVLILPATLLQKTENERKKYAQHWLIPKHIILYSYEMLGLVKSHDYFDQLKPDLLIFDEAHKLKNRKAARTRRVARYLKNNPNTKVVAMSGTIMRRSLKDFAHILRWCLKDNTPLPETEHELDEWAAALDEKVNEFERYEPGALFAFAPQGQNVNDVRRGFRKRLVETPGVVATDGSGEDVGSSLQINALQYNVEPQTEAHFYKLRTQMCTPDGWQLSEAVDVWRHAKELALGMYYKWDPRPPEDWRFARREWSAFVREVLSRSRTLDSELQVVQACDAGKLDNSKLEAWRAIRGTFTPNTVAVWCDDSALRTCLNWMKHHRGLVWTKHTLFAERLAKESGCKYYGSKGLTDTGEFIDNADPKQSAIASIDANKEGRNLQAKWNRMLIVSPTEGPDDWEQTIGRLHRTGQQADEVIVDVLLGCREHANAFSRAMAGAQAIQETTGAEYKMLMADINWPDEEEIAGFEGARWGNE